jgi:hypothetical protein
MDLNHTQTATLDGSLVFKPRAGEPSCQGCVVRGHWILNQPHEGLPCSPGQREDGKSGVWVKA